MKRILLVACCLLAFCRDAAADVIIGNSLSGPYLAGTNLGLKALEFRTGASGLFLDSIEVVLWGNPGGGEGEVKFTLHAPGANGLPGAVLSTIGSREAPPGFLLPPPQPYTIALPAPVLLNPNTTYWIQAEFFADPQTNGLTSWVRQDPAVAPSSPTGLATFVRYAFDSSGTGSGWVTSTTYNSIVVNGRVAANTSGTAARAILTGARCGAAITPLSDLQGDFGVDAFSVVDFDHVGWSGAAGILPASGPRVGAYVRTNNLVAAATQTPLGVGTGGARAIAFAKYRNNTAGTLVVPADATLDGEFSTEPNLSFRSGLCGDIDAVSFGSDGHATAAVYVFDADQFELAVTSGTSMPDYLIGGDTLGAYQSGTASALSLTRAPALAAALVVPEDFQRIDAAAFVPGMTVGPGTVAVAPNQSVIVVFDISAYSPPGAAVRFIDTLKPAPGFMAGMTPVGPFTPTPPAAANLTLAPAATTSPVATPVTLTATATTASGAPVPNTIVVFDMPAGPNAQPLGPALTNANGQVSFSYVGGAIAGIDVINARIGSLQSNVAEITWTTPGPLDHITVDPASATIMTGGSQAYSTQAFDAFNNSIGDVTANTTFSISPDGSCIGATCTATAAGPHTVTGTYSALTATATLNVNNVSTTFTFEGFFKPIDMSTPGLVVLNTIKAGHAVPVKWLLTLNGTPVSDPSSFAGLTSYPILCLSGVGSIEDAIEQIATGGSGLQDNGGGNWQFNWQTLSSYKNSCRAVVVKFSDGTTSPAANFKFK